ncbi:hypothetical protein SG34_012110 [Thalassomonas viridans]|uniref:Uncharacterized protein n=1 Tax=Thalassomonas viridans TaxID=137584 RepID=A0AAE9Z6A6_9GAMM|nr:hypothetical protein [Thalassomonas viridans]WDE07556.1 hypothetical protein SG34_012110 [Thalassomonas viridans]
MEEITGGFFSGIFRAIFSLFRWLLVEALIETCCYWLGRVTLLILTLGYYPRNAKASKHEGRITCFGVFIAITAIIITVVILN